MGEFEFERKALVKAVDRAKDQQWQAQQDGGA